MSAHRQHYQQLQQHPLPPADPPPAITNRTVIWLLVGWVAFCVALNAIAPPVDAVVTPVPEPRVEVYQPAPIGPDGLDPEIVTRLRADAFRAGFRGAVESDCGRALGAPIGSTP